MNAFQLQQERPAIRRGPEIEEQLQQRAAEPGGGGQPPGDGEMVGAPRRLRNAQPSRPTSPASAGDWHSMADRHRQRVTAGRQPNVSTSQSWKILHRPPGERRAAAGEPIAVRALHRLVEQLDQPLVPPEPSDGFPA